MSRIEPYVNKKDKASQRELLFLIYRFGKAKENKSDEKAGTADTGESCK